MKNVLLAAGFILCQWAPPPVYRPNNGLIMPLGNGGYINGNSVTLPLGNGGYVTTQPGYTPQTLLPLGNGAYIQSGGQPRPQPPYFQGYPR